MDQRLWQNHVHTFAQWSGYLVSIPAILQGIHMTCGIRAGLALWKAMWAGGRVFQNPEDAVFQC